MILRRLLFSAFKMAASNPAVQKQAAELTRKAVTKARPGLLKASRRAGELVRTTSDELADGVKQFKQGAKPKGAGGGDDASQNSTDNSAGDASSK